MLPKQVYQSPWQISFGEMMNNFFSIYGEKLAVSIAQHTFYVLITVLLGTIIALFLGIILSRYRKLSTFVLPVISIFQTIPGIVFIGILFLYIGMNPLTIITALTLYAIFPILKNTYTGLIGIPLTYIEAAKGCGMTKLQSLFKVEMPMALPSIFSGIRMTTIYITSWAVLASMIGQGGLGDFVYTGVDTNNSILIITGAIPSAILAILLSILIKSISNRVIKEGIKGNKENIV